MRWRLLILCRTPDPARNRLYRRAWTVCFLMASALGATALALDLEVPAILGLFVSILLAVGCCTCMGAFIADRPLRSAIPGTVTGAVVSMLAIGLSYLVGAW